MEVENLPSQTVTDQQLKPDLKVFAIASFWLGISCILIFSLGWLHSLTLCSIDQGRICVTACDDKICKTVGAAYITPQLSFVIGLIGIILGILGLKSSKRNLAKRGIVLCITGMIILPIGGIILILFVSVLLPYLGAMSAIGR